jgi:hypothetical protein
VASRDRGTLSLDHQGGIRPPRRAGRRGGRRHPGATQPRRQYAVVWQRQAERGDPQFAGRVESDERQASLSWTCPHPAPALRQTVRVQTVASRLHPATARKPKVEREGTLACDRGRARWSALRHGSGSCPGGPSATFGRARENGRDTRRRMPGDAGPTVGADRGQQWPGNSHTSLGTRSCTRGTTTGWPRPSCPTA